MNRRVASLLIMLMVGTGIYYFLSYNTLNKSVTPVSNSEIYLNKNYNISFNYYSNIPIIKNDVANYDPQSSQRLFLIFSDNPLYLNRTDPDIHPAHIFFGVNEVIECPGITLVSYISQGKDIIVGENHAKLSEGVTGYNSYTKEICLVKGKYSYLFSLEYPQDLEKQLMEKYSRQYIQIINSFKFTN